MLNIYRSIHIPVMNSMAAGTNPLTKVKVFNLFMPVITSRAQLRGWILLTDNRDGPAIPPSFIFQHTAELSPCSISNRFSQVMVFEQVIYTKVLQTDSLVITNQPPLP